MDLGLKGKRALVTGGTKGIGLAIVETFAAEGADVALCARNRADVDATVEAVKGRGVKATGAALDVTDAPALKAWIDGAAGELGGLDIIVANVSALGGGVSEEDWRNGLEVDVMATVHSIDYALPHIGKSEAGAVVAISSVSAVEVAGPRAYSAVKAAVIAHIKGLALQLAPKGIRANTVSPGTIYFDSGVWGKRKREQPQVYEAAFKRNPMGRMGTPQEVANATVFLASPAASFITGANLIVDGGITSRVQY